MKEQEKEIEMSHQALAAPGPLRQQTGGQHLVGYATVST